MERIPMFCVVHKEVPYPFPDRWIKPLSTATGKKISGVSLSIDSGVNISHLNRNFAELTAHYWASKNLGATEHIGFCHYRRYFNFITVENQGHPKLFVEPNGAVLNFLDSFEQEEQARRLLKRFDAITCRSYILNDTIEGQFIKSHSEEIWKIFIETIRKVSPYWISENLDYFQLSNKFTFYLMYIMKRNIFDEFIVHLFDVLFPIFEKIGDIQDSGGVRFELCRYPAYLAERFMMLYLFSRNVRTFEAQAITFEQNA